MKRLFGNDKFWWLLRLVIGGVFVYAGAIKLMEPLAFADSIATYQLVPKWGINFVALGLPPMEIIAGVMLILGWQQRLAVFCLLVFALVFCFALAQGLLRGLEIDCGCFGAGKGSVMKTMAALGRDVLLLAGNVLIYRHIVVEEKGEG